MQFDIRMLLAGIGLFLFGMYNMESGIRFLGQGKFKDILNSYTSNARSAAGIGAMLTGIIQSSTLVSLILIAFVGSGIMTLHNALGVIIGANIGTTLTSLLVALIGFGKFSISLFAFPILAIGGVASLFVKEKRDRSIAELVMGFGLLFLGLDFMKESVYVLQQTFDLAQYTSLGLPIFFIVGFLMTVVLQSSTVVSVLTLTALSAGIIDFPSSVAIVIGTNIGTTSTAALVSLGGSVVKRQLALGQILFNIGLSIVGGILFWPFIWLVQSGFGISNPLLANAVLNLIFNTSMALIVLPFIRSFTQFLERVIPDTQVQALEVESPPPPINPL